MDNYSQDRRFRGEGNEALYNLQEPRTNNYMSKPTETKYQYKECRVCLLSEAPEGGQVKILEDRTCEYCQIHNQLEKNSRPQNLWTEIYKIQRRGKAKQYDCIIGISGGLDSSTLLYWAVKYANLKPLVIHFDNGYNDKAAESNMQNLISKLNVNAIIYKLDKAEYDNLNLAFLDAGTPDADIPNDIAMTKLMYDTAKKYGIKWILNGHDFRTEGSTPAKWTYMDAKYIQDVYEKFTGQRLVNYPLFTFWNQIYYGLKGIKQIRPFHYNAIDRDKIEAEMKEFIGWSDYGAKHCENVYTEFVGAKLLPEKFKIDKRIVYLSARIRSGTITKEQAKEIMQTPPKFDMLKFTDPELRVKIEVMAKGEKRDRKEFKHYDFRKWSIVVYLLALAKVVPYTFWVKYVKKQN